MKLLLYISLLSKAVGFTISGFKAPFKSQLSAVISVQLEKPLGIILEEIEENAAKGVKVEKLSDSGSAYTSPYKDQLVGAKVTSINDKDVTCLIFDDVMDCIISSPSPVNIIFETKDEVVNTKDEEEKFDIGTLVEIIVLQNGIPDKIISGKVGDNLRKTLLDNNVELYRGLKKKLGNCGGGGQCTFCAVDFVEGQGWAERSDYENKKIAKYPTARLACLNNIQGPCVIRVE